jgi:hypothetical protein
MFKPMWFSGKKEQAMAQQEKPRTPEFPSTDEIQLVVLQDRSGSTVQHKNRISKSSFCTGEVPFVRYL